MQTLQIVIQIASVLCFIIGLMYISPVFRKVAAVAFSVTVALAIVVGIPYLAFHYFGWPSVFVALGVSSLYLAATEKNIRISMLGDDSSSCAMSKEEYFMARIFYISFGLAFIAGGILFLMQ